MTGATNQVQRNRSVPQHLERFSYHDSQSRVNEAGKMKPFYSPRPRDIQHLGKSDMQEESLNVYL